MLYPYLPPSVNRLAKTLVEVLSMCLNPVLYFHLSLLEYQMAANAPIVLLDGTIPTAVSHTFIGTGVDGNIATYTNRAENFVKGRETLTLRRKVTPNIRTCSANITVPRIITEVLNGVNVKRVADYLQGEIKFIVPATWETTDIAPRLNLYSNLIANAVFQALVKDDEFVW